MHSFAENFKGDIWNKDIRGRCLEQLDYYEDKTFWGMVNETKPCIVKISTM